MYILSLAYLEITYILPKIVALRGTVNENSFIIIDTTKHLTVLKIEKPFYVC